MKKTIAAATAAFALTVLGACGDDSSNPKAADREPATTGTTAVKTTTTSAADYQQSWNGLVDLMGASHSASPYSRTDGDTGLTAYAEDDQDSNVDVWIGPQVSGDDDATADDFKKTAVVIGHFDATTGTGQWTKGAEVMGRYVEDFFGFGAASNPAANRS